MNTTGYSEYKTGLIKGLPIALGYIPVSFTFGLMAANGGLPVWLSVFISMSNLTSAGQFAGTQLILAGATYFEITLTTFVINIRYMLMSLSLSQKIKSDTKLIHKLLFGFGITDETFAIASVEPGKLSHNFMYGLITLPIVGWTLGTLLGACTSSLLPLALQGAMGIALYGMFIAIIIPPAKKSRKILFTILISIILGCSLKYIPAFSFISSGFRVIIATIAGALISALIFPCTEEELS